MKKEYWIALVVAIALAGALRYLPAIMSSAPISTIISAVVVGVVAMYFAGSNRFANFFGSASRFISALVSATVAGVIVYLALVTLFGVNFELIHSEGGILKALQQPGQASANTIKGLAVIIAVISSFWLRYRSTTQRLWVFRLGIVLALGLLVVNSFELGPIVDRFTGQVADLRNEVMLPPASEEVNKFNREANQRLADAQKMAETTETAQEADLINAVKVGLLSIITIPEDVEVWLFTLTGEVVKITDESSGEEVSLVAPHNLINPQQPKPGSEWIVHSNIFYRSEQSALDYIQLVNRRNENIVQVIRQDYLNDIIGQIVKPSGQPEVQEDLTMAKVTETSAAPQVNLSSVIDVINVDHRGWIDSEVYPDKGDVIDVRGKDGQLVPEHELAKVMVRLGHLEPGVIGLNFPREDQLAYGLTEITGSNPLMLAVNGTLTKRRLRFKLSQPGELTIQVSRLVKPEREQL